MLGMLLGRAGFILEPIFSRKDSRKSNSLVFIKFSSGLKASSE